jgi:transcriptional regulator of acetoin/glycerol metabolism
MEAEQARAIRAALAEAQWNVSEVSRRLGIPRTTLYRKMKRYGIGIG